MSDTNEGAAAPAQNVLSPEQDYAMQALHYRGLMIQAQSMALDLRRELFQANEKNDALTQQVEVLSGGLADFTSRLEELSGRLSAAQAERDAETAALKGDLEAANAESFRLGEELKDAQQALEDARRPILGRSTGYPETILLAGTEAARPFEDGNAYASSQAIAALSNRVGEGETITSPVSSITHLSTKPDGADAGWTGDTLRAAE